MCMFRNLVLNIHFVKLSQHFILLLFMLFISCLFYKMIINFSFVFFFWDKAWIILVEFISERKKNQSFCQHFFSFHNLINETFLHFYNYCLNKTYFQKFQVFIFVEILNIFVYWSSKYFSFMDKSKSKVISLDICGLTILFF